MENSGPLLVSTEYKKVLIFLQVNDIMLIRLIVFCITDVSPTMVCLTNDSPIAILPNVCSPN